MSLPSDTRLEHPEDHRFFIETGDQDGPAAVYFLEYLDWHHESYPEVMSTITDAEGWLTPAALAQTAKVVRALMGDDALPGTLEAEDQVGGDDPNIALSIALPDVDDEDGAWDAAHPFIAACIDLADPGTFGVPYLFGQVARDLDAA